MHRQFPFLKRKLLEGAAVKTRQHIFLIQRKEHFKIFDLDLMIPIEVTLILFFP